MIFFLYLIQLNEPIHGKEKGKKEKRKKTTPAGFEPARAMPNGLAGHRLNQLGQSVIHD